MVFLPEFINVLRKRCVSEGVRVGVGLCYFEVPNVTDAQSSDSSWEEHLKVTLQGPDAGVPGAAMSLNAAQPRRGTQQEMNGS